MSNKENREDDFGKRLMMLLEAADMTRADLARCFGTSQSTVFSWFGKGFKPSLEYAIKIPICSM